MLREFVLSFVNAVRGSPLQGSNPEWLDALEVQAFQSLDGAYFAEMAPVTPWTWEQRTILPGDELTSDRVPFRFPYAVEILGMRGVAIPITTTGAVLAPAVDPSSVTGDALDILDVKIDINAQNFITNANGISTPGGPNDGNFVTISSLNIQAPRLHALKLDGESPDIGFTFRWSAGLLTFPSVWADTMIKMAMYVRPLPPAASYNVPDIPRYGARR
jgi:hypothetical protein